MGRCFVETPSPTLPHASAWEREDLATDAAVLPLPRQRGSVGEGMEPVFA